MNSKEPFELSRRSFLKASSATIALAGVGFPLLAATDEVSVDTPPSEKVTLGFIGMSWRGNALMNNFMASPDVQVGAVCDVYEPRLQAAKAKAGNDAKAYADFRKLLEQKDIDAVVIATPPHWHPLMSIMACQAGKDVYCEKPISLYPAESIAMQKAASENNRVTQVGTQIHASENFRRAVEIVRSGVLGNISAVRVICNVNEYPGVELTEDSAPPANLDWDTWLGPARKIPFNKAKFDVYHNYKDYVGSWLHELGPHLVDLAYWAMRLGEPNAVSASGGRYVLEDMTDVPDTMDVLWEYDDFNMTWMHTWCNGYNFGFGGAPDGGRKQSVIFQGTKGTLVADYDNLQVIADGNRIKDFKAPTPSIPTSPGHQIEFIDSVKSRKQPPCSFDYHAPLALALNLAHISLYTGRKLHWDAKNSKVIDDSEAEKMCTPDYRKPWALPI